MHFPSLGRKYISRKWDKQCLLGQVKQQGKQIFILSCLLTGFLCNFTRGLSRWQIFSKQPVLRQAEFSVPVSHLGWSFLGLMLALLEGTHWAPSVRLLSFLHSLRPLTQVWLSSHKIRSHSLGKVVWYLEVSQKSGTHWDEHKNTKARLAEQGHPQAFCYLSKASIPQGLGGTSHLCAERTFQSACAQEGRLQVAQGFWLSFRKGWVTSVITSNKSHLQEVLFMSSVLVCKTWWRLFSPVVFHIK